MSKKYINYLRELKTYDVKDLLKSVKDGKSKPEVLEKICKFASKDE